jgi:D-glycero-D-manno-heptose 1,7-bisphosphate phosphatase
MTAAGVFLDRDGVLNAASVRDGRPHPPQTVADLSVLPGVPDACHAMAAAGLRLICITNQPDIARGTQDADVVATLNVRLQEALDLDEVVTCPHDDADGCECRKPKPGMILDAAERWGVDLARSVTVGDRWRDVEAGRSAGTRTVFIDRGYAERAPAQPDLTVADLQEAVPWIIATAGPRR